MLSYRAAALSLHTLPFLPQSNDTDCTWRDSKEDKKPLAPHQASSKCPSEDTAAGLRAATAPQLEKSWEPENEVTQVW